MIEVIIKTLGEETDLQFELGRIRIIAQDSTDHLRDYEVQFSFFNKGAIELKTRWIEEFHAEEYNVLALLVAALSQLEEEDLHKSPEPELAKRTRMTDRIEYYFQVETDASESVLTFTDADIMAGAVNNMSVLQLKIAVLRLNAATTFLLSKIQEAKKAGTGDHKEEKEEDPVPFAGIQLKYKGQSIGEPYK